MHRIAHTDKALWDGFTGEVRADYMDLMELLPELPQRPRTERGMTAWADLARGLLLQHADYACRRGIRAAFANAPEVAVSWKERGAECLAMARRLGDLMDLPATSAA